MKKERLTELPKKSFSKLNDEIMERTDISSSSKLIYSILWRLFNKKTGCAYPKIDQIAQKVGLNARQVRYCLTQLEEKHLIEIERNIGKPNSYYILRSTNKCQPLQNSAGVPLQNSAAHPYKIVHPPLQNSAGVIPLYNNRIINREKIEETVSPFVLSIFDHWKESAQAKGMRDVQGEALDPDRIKTIENALLYNSEQKLKKAINGCLENEWYRNSGNYGIGYILRNNDNITKFVNMQNSPNNPDSDISKEARQALQNIFAKRQTSEAARNAYNLARKELNTNNLGTYQDEKKVYSVFGRYYLQEKSKR